MGDASAGDAARVWACGRRAASWRSIRSTATLVGVGKWEARLLAVGFVVSAIVVLATVAGEWSPRAEDTEPDEIVASNESAVTDVPTLHETLAEYARGVPNYGYAPGSPAGTYAIYCPSFDTHVEAEIREYRALLESFSPGVRASFEGADGERNAAWKEEWKRREAERKRDEAERERDEAEYAVFIEEHLRRLYDGNEEADD